MEKSISIEEVEASIPPGMPDAIRKRIGLSLQWLELLEDHEAGDPRQIQATLHILMATVAVYNLAAETARQVKR